MTESPVPEPVSPRTPRHRRVSRRVRLLLLVAAPWILIVLITWFAEVNRYASEYPPMPHVSVTPSPENDQVAYQATITAERGALLSGYLITPKVVRGEIDKPSQFSMTICGSGSSNEHCGLTTERELENPSSVLHEEVRVGSLIRSRATTNANAEITLLSSETQPVIEPTDSATWSWIVRPKESGRFLIYMTVSTMRQGTDETLLPDQEVKVALEVDWTVARGVKDTNTFLTVWLPIIVSILAMLGLGEFLRRRRERRSNSATVGPVEASREQPPEESEKTNHKNTP